MDYKVTSRSEDETSELAQNLESEKFAGMVICLNGELGSGKTLFVKAFAKALGINDEITSPTFNIIKEYLDGEMDLYHMDVYRVEGDYDSIGISDYFNKNGISIIEWAEMISDILPEERLDINFQIAGENTRIITLCPHGEKYEELVSSVIQKEDDHMYSLLIDTHDKNVLLVLYKDGKVLDMIDKESNMRHSEITMPSLVELIEKNGLTINEIKEIFAVVGPGSFTGVRIGVVIAKTIAYLLNIPIKCVTSIDLLYYTNNIEKGTYSISEKNGRFVCEYDGTSLTTNDIKYYSNKEFDEKFSKEDVYTKTDLDLSRVYKYASKLNTTNPHVVNPIYVKQIEVLK